MPTAEPWGKGLAGAGDVEILEQASAEGAQRWRALMRAESVSGWA